MKVFLAVVVASIFLLYLLSYANKSVVTVFNPPMMQVAEEINFDNFQVAAWLWISPSKMNDNQIDFFLSRAEEEKISTLYVYSDDVLAFYPSVDSVGVEKSAVWSERAKRLISEAHKRNIKIHALGGASNWSNPENHQEALSFFDFVIAYNKEVPVEFQFDGIQFDVEPYGQRIFPGNEVRILRSYLDLATKIVEKYDSTQDSTGEQFQLGFAVPYWFDGENKKSIISWRDGEPKGVGLFLIDILSKSRSTYLAMMDYRNFAEGNDGSIAHARGEIEYAKKTAPNVGIVIGQETIAVRPTKVTFHGMSKDALKMEMKKIAAAFKSEQVFKGFAIHTLESYIEFK